MKYKILTICLMFSILGHSQHAPEVMILGTYHFDNPGLDAANLQSDDVTTEKRQKELEELTRALLEFKPTKIAVESPYGDSTMIKRYISYLENKDLGSLGANEIYQVGFRIAAAAGHGTIYPVDYRLDLGTEAWGQLMASQPEKGAYVQGYIGAIQDSLNIWTENILLPGTIPDFLRFFNTEEMIEGNYAIYLDFLKELYGDENYAGAEMLAKWHERNLIIFQNLTRIADFGDPEERILVIYGQGHVKILKDLVQDADYFKYAEILDYLPDN